MKDRYDRYVCPNCGGCGTVPDPSLTAESVTTLYINEQEQTGVKVCDVCCGSGRVD